jgi:hypothetical protein
MVLLKRGPRAATPAGAETRPDPGPASPAGGESEVGRATGCPVGQTQGTPTPDQTARALAAPPEMNRG